MECFYEAKHDSENIISSWVQPNIPMPPHFHNCIEFLYVTDGELKVTVDGVTNAIHSGDIMLAASFAVHEISALSPGQCHVILIPRSCIPEWNTIFDNKTFAVPFTADDSSQSLLTLFRLIDNIMHERDMFSDMFHTREERNAQLRPLAIALVNIIVHRCTLVPRQRLTNMVAEAVNFIHQNYRRKLLLSDVARGLYCNSQQLSIKFREVMHISIADYITSLRTVEAARLLTEHPELKLEDVVERSGFQSMRSMFRAFHERYGCTPAEIKRDKLGK